MFADFSLTDSGDLLIIEKPESIQLQKISFNISNFKTQKINFDIYSEEASNNRAINSLKLSFILNDIDKKYLTPIITDKEQKIQLAKIKLNTCINELPYRTSFGSELIKYKHKNITNEILREIENYVKDDLIAYFPGINVTASTYINYINGYDQKVIINIYDNDNLLLSYDLN